MSYTSYMHMLLLSSPPSHEPKDRLVIRLNDQKITKGQSSWSFYNNCHNGSSLSKQFIQITSYPLLQGHDIIRIDYILFLYVGRGGEEGVIKRQNDSKK